MKKYIIGIDIGGTNTDAVIIDENQNIISSCKTSTTDQIADGFIKAINILLSKAKIKPNEISAVNVGTTHATNALLQKKDLLTVGVIRIAGQNPFLPPAYGWPADTRSIIYKDQVTINGGFECDGKEITKFNTLEISKAVDTILSTGAQSIAIIGVFSPIYNHQEIIVEKIIKKIAGEKFPVTLSSSIGGAGFIERENSTILNCALAECIKKGFSSLEESLKSLKIQAPLFMTQNNGTIITIEKAINYPILTISAGPTNSFIGGTKLAKLSNAIVVDIGGTSTDVGIVINGFARRTLNSSYIDGIKLNFAMPDVLSVALGGGSHINFDKNNNCQIGPESCARKILKDAVSFGGSILTLTDIAILEGFIKIDGANPKLTNLPEDKIKIILNILRKKIINLINIITGPQKFPVILVGGGADLLPKDFIQNSIRPKYFNVANAYGAAMSEISGNVDTVASLTNRDEILEKLKIEAIENAIANGADKKTVRIVNMQIIPYHYVPDNLARVIITSSGRRT